jgi:hypothetical protein
MPVLILSMYFFLPTALANQGGSWRSKLFPENWQPKNDRGQGGTTDQQGRFLPDFSYAGYHRGEDSVNWSASRISKTLTIDKNMYGNGINNATTAIQTAIDRLCNEANPGKKLRVVHIPAGTYLLKIPNEQASAAIHIHCSYLLLRGDGENTKLLFNDPEHARNKSVILLAPKPKQNGQANVLGMDDRDILSPNILLSLNIAETKDSSGLFANDTIAEQRQIKLEKIPNNLNTNDWVLVHNDITPQFRTEHKMENYWSKFSELAYFRKITHIDHANKSITLDIPLRYPLKKRDRARVIKIKEKDFIEESGIVKLSIGMVQSAPPKTPGKEEWDEVEDYSKEGTPAYKVAFSNAIKIEKAHDLWIQSVNSFEPAQNKGSGVHVLSHGIFLGFSAFRTHIDDCKFGRPQYRGAGGNGYLYHIQGSDNLITRVQARHARHGISINHAASGNVVKNAMFISSLSSEDTHKYLSHANLWDNITLNQAFICLVNRGEVSNGGGFTSTAGVVWNTKVIDNHPSAKECAVESVQWGWGYIIGTSAQSGKYAKICLDPKSNQRWSKLKDTGDPKDFIEGENIGVRLAPQSLYEAQLKLRLSKLDGRKNCSKN